MPSMNTADFNAGASALEPRTVAGAPPAQPDQKMTVRQARNVVAIFLLVAIAGLVLGLLSRKDRSPEEAAPAPAEEIVEQTPMAEAATQGEVELFDGTMVDPATVLSWWPLEPADEDDIETLLAQGEVALAARRWIEPEGDNALQAFLAVLATDPDNETARMGREAVASHYRIVAVEHLANGELDAAERAIAATSPSVRDAS